MSFAMTVSNFPTQDACVIVFGRYPRPGHVKTRLIPLLGPLGAADLQRRLTEKIIDTLLSAGYKIRFDYDGAGQRQVRRWLDRAYLEIVPQNGGDLGRRMAASLNSALASGYGRVVLVGTDLPDITADHIHRAIQALDDHDLVLGPSIDGGYWLVGARKPVAIFNHMPWGTDGVLARTMDKARRQGLKTTLLDPLNDIDTPDDLKAWQPRQDGQGPYLSVILPVLNEAERIESAIGQVQSPHTQVIVVDGGSRDRTIELAREQGARVIRCPTGRAVQQNLGARLATGHVLLFLHADTRLPREFDTQLFEILMDPDVVLGAFRFKTDLQTPVMRLIEKAANIRSVRFHLPYGDQGFFMRRSDFWRIGGFPNVPIAEDLLLARRLARIGSIETASGHAVTSARRWRSLGVGRTTLINYLIAGGCLLGIDPTRLAPLYGFWTKKKRQKRSGKTSP